ncbi:MAG: 16S rRNA (adenine(1518)-N(6)/adenine(1519)-N(6))-dimethyltransferase RsmA [Candidatus Thermoplasmatota archaeon]|nr:16S rRNA (adenine(1518)-N(6)/adenine(1519)-N(6))-dimethyltransferase RsmA [Candidatus Thermoplasmatota archaeon]MCL5731727.1 16S rRNA (adenine(1518)-N(6)/adenine(1519)-N(6))-dimethyltransferase RsmA [Candidatus Thermoplasmatota archaeon]
MTQERHFKKYGQIFLKNKAVATLEARSMDIAPGSRVLEIGPGNGILTEQLLKRGFNVISVESDHRFVENLYRIFPENIKNGQLTVIKGDFMQYEAGDFDGIAGNIPYGISSEILERLTELNFRCAVLMLQKEFADRLLARPGQNGFSRISALSYLNFESKRIRNISAANFYPRPEVTSTIVYLRKKQFKDFSGISAEISRVFSNKRKKLKNTMKNVPEGLGDLRIEQLSEEDFLRVVKSFTSTRSDRS